MITSRNWKRKAVPFSQKKLNSTIVLILCALLASLVYIHYAGTFYTKPQKGIEDLVVLPSLSNERRFLETFKSCLNAQKCFQHIPDGAHVQRIAILSPPGILIENFVKILKEALLLYYNGNVEEMDRSIELLPSSHVPPYGYGKNHGLTKILRLYHASLLTQVMDTIQFRNQRLAKLPDFRNQDTSQTMRQVIRWHCRLSHVAAHTAMYNVDLSVLDGFELQKIVQFIVSKPGHDPLTWNEETIDVLPSGPHFRFSDKFTVDKDILSRFQSNVHSSEMDEILSAELDVTQNLSQWPCLSFWRKGSNVGPRSKRIDDAADEMVAKMMAPKCSMAFVKCSVKFDDCEEKGDIFCR